MPPCAALHVVASQVIPGMVERGRGTIIFTGSSASVTGFAGYSDLSKWAGDGARLQATNPAVLPL